MLVIIGLIVGGVLTGQSLIAAATVRAQITQIEKFNTAAATFQGKYGGLPGDLQLSLANQFGFNSSTCTGNGSYPEGGRNGDGLIEGAGLGGPDAEVMGETALFWTDLTTADLIQGTYPGPGASFPSCDGGYAISASDPSTGNISYYLPVASLSTTNFVYVYSALGRNWYGLSAVQSVTSSQINSGTTIPVSQAYAIDKKIDDGLPSSGTVQAVYLNASQTTTTLAPNAATDGATTCYNTTGPAYSVGFKNGAGANCALSFLMQAGD